MSEWFRVDRQGLGEILERRGKAFAVFELLQNAWDQNVSQVIATLTPLESRPFARLVVTDDDPNGFADLADAFTLFRKTVKRSNPTQRGRFNIGEKLVLALCRSAQISSTTGTVLFKADGSRSTSRSKRESGSEFCGDIRMTRDEYDDVCRAVSTLIPPTGVMTYFNGERLRPREPVITFEAVLPTEMADDTGAMRRTQRKTVVEVYNCNNGECPHVYEMGIPVVETDSHDRFHINVMQKVPLNVDRDNVTPAYLKLLRVEVLNHTHDLIGEADVNADWVRSASSDPRCSDAAISSVLDHRFGVQRVSYDPSDRESNMLAVSLGHTLVTGSQMSAGEWANARRAAAILPAGQVTPARPRFDGIADPIPEDSLSPSMRSVRDFTKALGQALMGVDIGVSFLDCSGSFRATYGNRHLTFYVRNLGDGWFDLVDNMHSILWLLIHEFGHEYEGNHLSAGYHDALCTLGAKLTQLALSDPGFFYPSNW